MTSILKGITFTRNPEGGFTKVDNWPVGRKLAQIQIEDHRPYGKMSLSAAVEVIEGAINSGKAPATVYKIIPLRSDPMPANVKELLGKVRATKAVKYNSCSFDGCDTTYPSNKGRYQNKFCPSHRTQPEVKPPAPIPAVETELE